MDGYQDVVLSVLRAGPPPRAPRGARSIFIDDRPIKTAFDALAVECALTLDLEQGEVLDVLQEVVSAAPFGLLRRIDRATRARGVALKPRKRDLDIDHVGIMRVHEQMDQAFSDFLRMIADSHPPRTLSWGERRRLDELARLFTGLLVSESHPRDLDLAMEGSTDDLQALVGAVVSAGAFELERLAAEAHAALAELAADAPKHDVSLLLMDSAGTPLEIQWDHVNTDVLLALLGSTRWIALVAATILDSTPSDQQTDLARRVVTIAERLRPWHRRLAGELAVRLDPSNATLASWSEQDDALLRSVAAGAAAETGNSGILGKLLRDGDALVRLGGLIHVDPDAVAADDDLRLMVEAAGTDAFDLRTCRWCGTANPPVGEPNCSECGLALSDPKRAAAILLDGRELSYEGEATQTAIAQI